MARSLPVPADFAANAELTNDQLAGIYGPHRHETFAKWRASVDVRITAKRRRFSIPADWHEVAPGKHTDTLKAHYGVSQKVISRWRKETGVTGDKPIRKTKLAKRRGAPAPADFAEIAGTMLLVELCAHYGHSSKLINRWLRQSGLQAKPYHLPKPAAVKTRRVIAHGPGSPFTAPIPPPLAGREEEAAHYLRRFYAGVSRSGAAWRCGTATLSDQELIERARRNGWDPDAWKRLAGVPIRQDALPSFPKTKQQGARHG